ncbi:hypothetical protein X777_02504 [Ooceraea biroi]|uniref:Uncharacterized protein n=1 Tax=Ooceraea biroi TaxID=2015173 RepID=A0A026WMU5_OOCBI|nr:hypothetical protein X777_02504 [Ooceraea biroi]
MENSQRLYVSTTQLPSWKMDLMKTLNSVMRSVMMMKMMSIISDDLQCNKAKKKQKSTSRECMGTLIHFAERSYTKFPPIKIAHLVVSINKLSIYG